MRVLIDDATPGRERLLAFARPSLVIRVDTPAGVEPALRRIAAAQASGGHLAGYFSYELGYLLEPRLRRLLPAATSGPLLWFGVFDAPVLHKGGAASDLLASLTAGRAYATPLVHEWSVSDYSTRFARVRRYIADGDIYQANLSFRSHFTFAGDPIALYRALRTRAAAANSAFIDDGERQILSLSPELFFALMPNGQISARPMKGTAPRGSDPASDAAAREALRRSEKDRAENLMIVDLLRNDLGRVAEIGSVEAGNLFSVETYPTLHTMVSTVRAKLKPGTDVRGILRALFPCGSVTGAPKIRAMEIIRELEESSRGVYCGAIGYFAPDGSARFNVAIRTLIIRDGDGELGIGGAVVQDSTARGEYDECLLKARYYEAARKPLQLIETLRWQPGAGFARLERHLARMQASAATFGLPFDQLSAGNALAEAVRGTGEAQRVRLSLDEAGKFACAAAPFGMAQPAWSYEIARQSVCSTDLLLQHKTNWRELFETEARQSRADEVIFLNERGELTEGSRSNIFVRKNSLLLTPPLGAGLLNGILRQTLLEEGACFEAPLTPTDLVSADEVMFGNSLRGLIRAFPLESSKALSD